MQHKVLKYILDIEIIITEIETIKSRLNNDFNQFSNDVIMQRAVERDLDCLVINFEV
jgi:hypothetical protein